MAWPVLGEDFRSFSEVSLKGQDASQTEDKHNFPRVSKLLFHDTKNTMLPVRRRLVSEKVYQKKMWVAIEVATSIAVMS